MSSLGWEKVLFFYELKQGNCFLRSRLLLGEKFCATVAGFRLVVDVGVIIIVALLIVGETMIMHEVKSFKVVDESGNSTMLVRDIGSGQE